MEQKLQHYGLQLLAVSQRLLEEWPKLDREGEQDCADAVIAAVEEINGVVATLGEAVMILQDKGAAKT